LFDAIKWFALNGDGHDEILFIDPDCLITEPLQPIRDAISRSGCVLYDLKFPSDLVGNGLSRAEMTLVRDEIWGEGSARLVRWFGGEFIGLSRPRASEISAALEVAWDSNLDLHARGKLKCNTEEQLLSLIVDHFNIPFSDAGGYFVKRMWTAARFRNHSPKDVEVLAWHMPAEKTRGFLHLFDLIMASDALPFGDLAHGKKEKLSAIMHLKGDALKSLAYIVRTLITNILAIISGKIPSFSANV
jgi:hypothetical protein